MQAPPGLVLLVTVLAFALLQVQGGVPHDLKPYALRKFAKGIKGEVIINPSEEFCANLLWGGINKGPGAPIPPQTPKILVTPDAGETRSVIKSVRFAKKYGLEVRGKGSGHHFSGVSLVKDGMTIQLTRWTHFTIDAKAQTAYVQPGVTMKQFTTEAAKQGLHFPVAHFGSITFGGYVLGGGWGLATRAYGAAVDNVLQVDIVVALKRKIKLISATPNSYADLFRVVRGAGGPLGIAVGFKIKLHPLPQTKGLVRFQAIAAVVKTRTQALKAMQYWKKTFVPSSPRSLGTYALFNSPKADGNVTLNFLNIAWGPGTSKRTNASLAGLRNFAVKKLGVDASQITDIFLPYTNAIALFEPSFNFPNATAVVTECFVEDISHPRFVNNAYAAIKQVIDGRSAIVMGTQAPPVKNPGLRNVYGFRDTYFVGVIATWQRKLGAAADGDAANIKWQGDTVARLSPVIAGYYINNIRFANPQQVRACYSAEDWKRIEYVKAKYDPYGVFRPLLWSVESA